jgi:hypothetical protein
MTDRHHQLAATSAGETALRCVMEELAASPGWKGDRYDLKILVRAGLIRAGLLPPGGEAAPHPRTRGGANGMKYGDWIITPDGRRARAGEFMPDGDVDVTYEDGTGGQVKWHRCRKAEATPEQGGEARCGLCGEPMPPGEEMFKFHGYSGPCPKLPLPAAPAVPDAEIRAVPPEPDDETVERAWEEYNSSHPFHNSYPSFCAGFRAALRASREGR